MALEEIDVELEKMSAEEAEVYNAVLCNELFLAFFSNFLTYNKPTFEAITESNDYRIFKKRYLNLSAHAFYDVYTAFLEGRRKDYPAQIQKSGSSLNFGV